MSWLDLISNNKMKITTADGVVHTPLWKNANMSGDFNSSKFDYISLKGTFVYRGEKPGNSMSLELYFVGENCIEDSNAFDLSLSDKRPIEIEHPYYGLRTVQPISFSRDDKKLNVSKWELAVFDTIETTQPKEINSLTDTIELSIQATYSTVSDEFANKATLSSESLLLCKGSIDNLDDEFEKKINISTQFAEFKNKVGEAVRAADNILTDAKSAINAINNLLEYPATVADTVKSRVSSFKSSLNKLSTTVQGYTSLQALEYYTSFGASTVNSICKAVVNPNEGDYVSRNDIVFQIEELNEIFETYISNIDAKTTNDAGVKGAFSPDASTINAIYSTYIYTIANLIELIQDSKIERELTTDKDTNIILLAHYIYGLDQNDSTIDLLINLNDLKRNNFIQIKKGTKIKYIK